MKKIVFLHSSLENGGAENLRYQLLKNIDKTRYAIRLCCIEKKGVIGEKIENLGFRVDELKQGADSRNILATYRLVKYMRKERPDILHSCLFNANFHGRIAGFLCRTPFIITEEHGEHKQYEGIKFLPFILADFVLARITDFIICCSRELKEDIIRKERISSGKLLVIENCLDLSVYKVSIEKSEVRSRHGIGSEPVFILAGSLKSGKGHELLLEVLSETKKEGHIFRCFFAGDGPLKERLIKMARELDLVNEVIFLGNVNNIADYMNASDIFVLPSFSEGLSIALLESMYMGLACIVTDVGSNAALIKTGANGIVIAPYYKQGLKKAIIFCLQNRDLIKDFGRRSRSVIESGYSSINERAQRYYELWNKCIIHKK